MDLSTVSIKLHSNSYLTVNDFRADLELIFSNCFTYNSDPNNFAHKQGKLLQNYYDYHWGELHMNFYFPIKAEEVRFAAPIFPNEDTNYNLFD